MEEVNLLFQMEIFIKENGSQEKCMEEDIIVAQPGKNCKGFGNMEI
jgi:hypothetical protein